MAMRDQEPLASAAMAQHQPFIGVEIAFLDMLNLSPLHLVIANDQVQPTLRLETAQQGEYLCISSLNLAEVGGLPQIIPITEFDVGKACLEIVAQGVEKECFIGRKFVSSTFVATMGVAEKDNF